MKHPVLLATALVLAVGWLGACAPGRAGDEVVLRKGKYEAIDF